MRGTLRHTKGVGRKSTIRFVGLDVRADTVAVAEPDGEVRSLGMIPNRLESVFKLVAKLGPAAMQTRPFLRGGNGRL
jgi:hypothetical protein